MTPRLTWPEDDGNGVLGDGRFASVTHHPKSVDELRSIVQSAVASGLAIYPQGGGTSLGYGGIPNRPGVAVRLGRIARVIDYPFADMTVTVEAGMTLSALRALLARQGQRLAIEAAHPDAATLGGIYATASTGPRRFGWGRPRDQIIGVSFVAGDGELVRGGGRVVKNVAGYDFPKLLTGSLGTLGIITELTLKVSPRPEASAVILVVFDSLSAARAALDQLNVSGTRPIALELIDDYLPDGPPRGGQWSLMVGFEGNRAAVEWQVRRLESELGRTELNVLRDHEAETVWLSIVDHEAGEGGPLGFSSSFAPSRVIEFLARVDPEAWSIRVHAGNGVVRGVARSDGDLETWASEVERLRAEASRLGGSLVLPRCPTSWKGRLNVWGPPRPDWTIAEKVKLALDPGRVLNPGRFIGTI